MPYTIKPAAPINSRILMAIAGPQGSGKTTTALRIATGITNVTGGKICVIDTEAKRALRYANAFKFNHLEIEQPFSPQNYDDAVKFAQSQGYGAGDVLIIDSMTHEHEGPGGVLEMHEDFIDKKTNNSDNYRERDKYNLMAWNYAKKGRKRFIYFTLQTTQCHVILCFRAKEKITQEKVGGKTEYVKGGLQPIGGDEYFYEMDINIILPEGSMGKPDWSEKASRINEYGDDRPLTKLLHGTDQITEATGEQLAKLSMVSPPVDAAKNRIQSMAKEIVSKIRACSDSGDLMYIMEDNEAEIVEIKEVSQPAFDFITKEYEAKRAALGG